MMAALPSHGFILVRFCDLRSSMLGAATALPVTIGFPLEMGANGIQFRDRMED